jgi:transcriptional regulator with XRE-family HTH domain
MCYDWTGGDSARRAEGEMADRRQPRVTGDPEGIGAVLTRLRLARGYSQLRLAERLCVVAGTPTVTRHEVSRWEREERVPGPFWLSWLAVVLDTTLPELEAAVATGRREPPGARRPAADQHRLWRPPSAGELLAGLGHATGNDLRELAHAWLAGPPELSPEPGIPTGPAGRAEPERLPVPSGPPPVPGSGAALDRLEVRLCELRRMDDLIGGIDLVSLIDRELRAAIGVLQAAGGSRSRLRALLLVGQFAQLTGWVHADAGDPAGARRAYRIALRAAAAGGDRQFAGHVLGCLSHLVLADGDPHQALLLAHTARSGASPGASAFTRALLLQRVALAAAACGERREGHAALAAAERAADRSRPEREPPWLYWLDSPEQSAMIGRCLIALGRSLRGTRQLSIPRRPTGPRTAALYAAWLARGYLELGEVEVACRVAMRGLRNAIRAGSARAATGLRQLHPLLLRHSDVPAVRNYQRLVTAVAELLPAPVPPARGPAGTRQPAGGGAHPGRPPPG